MSHEPISIRVVIEEIVTLLTESAEIQAFVQAKYAKKMAVFEGYDFQNPPKEGDCPCISIHSDAHEGVSPIEMKSHYVFEIIGSIFNEAKENEDVATHFRQTFTGQKEAEEFIYLIQAALAGRDCPLKTSRERIEFSGVVLNPIFEGSLSLTIELQKSLGGHFPTAP